MINFASYFLFLLCNRLVLLLVNIFCRKRLRVTRLWRADFRRLRSST